MAQRRVPAGVLGTVGSRELSLETAVHPNILGTRPPPTRPAHTGDPASPVLDASSPKSSHIYGDVPNSKHISMEAIFQCDCPWCQPRLLCPNIKESTMFERWLKREHTTNGSDRNGRDPAPGPARSAGSAGRFGGEQALGGCLVLRHRQLTPLSSPEPTAVCANA